MSETVSNRGTAGAVQARRAATPHTGSYTT
jgi:hypothetical protein